MSGAEAQTGWRPDSALPCRDVVQQERVLCGVAQEDEDERASRAANLEMKKRRGGYVAVERIQCDVRGRADEKVPDFVLCLQRISNTRR
jgi:hypothetical protein